MVVTTVEWVKQQQLRLESQPVVGYAQGQPPAAEPVAISALTATGYELRQSAESACKCLLASQNENGSVATQLKDQGPFWTTSLACIAWHRFALKWASPPAYRDAVQRRLDFLLSFGGEQIEPNDEVGHNTLLVGWPWVQGTHSWLEPTAFALLALRHCNQSAHPGARSGRTHYGSHFTGRRIQLRQYPGIGAASASPCSTQCHQPGCFASNSGRRPIVVNCQLSSRRTATSRRNAVFGLELTGPHFRRLGSTAAGQCPICRGDHRLHHPRTESFGEPASTESPLLLALLYRASPILDLPNFE